MIGMDVRVHFHLWPIISTILELSFNYYSIAYGRISLSVCVWKHGYINIWKGLFGCIFLIFKIKNNNIFYKGYKNSFKFKLER